MKIVLQQQILTGNLNDGFVLSPYLAALESEYRKTIKSRYPGAEIEINTDVQSASGYCRPLSVSVFDDAGGWIDDGGDLVEGLNNDAEKLADDARWYA